MPSSTSRPAGSAAAHASSRRPSFSTSRERRCASSSSYRVPGGEQTRAVLDLLAFAGDAILCGHNLQFDLRFLDRELRTSGMRVAAPVLDTLRLARRLLSGRSERLGLGDLCELLGTPTRPEHRALTDAHAAAELLGRLLTLAEDRARARSATSWRSRGHGRARTAGRRATRALILVRSRCGGPRSVHSGRMASEVGAPTVTAIGAFGDRLAGAVERQAQPARRRSRPPTRAPSGRAPWRRPCQPGRRGRGVWTVLLRDHGRCGAVRRGGQASACLLRGPRGRRDYRLRGRVPLREIGRAARDRRRQARRHRLDRPRVCGGLSRGRGGAAAAARTR